MSAVSAFRAHALRLRPVWTITWRDLSAPSLRSGTPEVTEEDLWHNKQVAQDYYDKHGLKGLSAVTAYVKASKQLAQLVEYRVDSPAYSVMARMCGKNTITIYTPEKTAMQYLMNLLLSCVVHCSVNHLSNLNPSLCKVEC